MPNDTRKTHQSKLPLWMQTLLDRDSVDAWSEDPDIQQTEPVGSKGNQGRKVSK